MRCLVVLAVLLSASSASAAEPTPDRIGVAFGMGAGAELVDVDGHYRTEGSTWSLRGSYDHAVSSFLEIGAVLTYQHMEHRVPHAVLPGVRVRAHVGSGAFDAGLVMRLTGLVVVMPDVKASGRDEYATHTWFGGALSLAVDARYWVGDLAFELSPEITVGLARDPHANGWYLSGDCTHLSLGAFAGLIYRF